MDYTRDTDPVETKEWLDSLDGVIEVEGPERAHFLLNRVMDGARQKGAPVPYSANTPYLNTIPVEKQPPHPGDRAIEHRIRSVIRWNALAIVLRANKTSSELGGHIASFQSSALLYDTGYQHFWHAPSENHGGDLIYIQGHVAPGIYARSFVDGPPDRGAAAELPPGGRRQGPLLLPPSLADAGLLAVPDGLDGPRALDGDLPGALPQVSALPRAGEHRKPQGLGVSRRRRDGRAGVDGRDLPRGARETRQPRVRHQLQPATPRRSGARQRQGGPGAGGPVPRRGLERHQVPLGLGLGRAARQGHLGRAPQDHGGDGRRRVPGLQVEERRLRARALLRQDARDQGAGGRHVGRPDLGARARRP